MPLMRFTIRERVWILDSMTKTTHIKPQTPCSFPPDGKGWSYFSAISIENIRCFGPKQTLTLTTSDEQPARWTVILGENGTGKTTLLQAIAVMALKQHDRDAESRVPLLVQRLNNISGWSFHELESLQKKRGKQSTLEASVSQQSSAQSKNERWDYGVSWVSSGSVTASGLTVPNKKMPLIQCFAYGAARRVQEINTVDDASAERGHETLFNDSIGLRDPAELIAQEYLVAAFQQDTSWQEQERAARRITQIKNALVDVLPDVTGIETSVQSRRPVVLFETSYGKVRSSQLSSGYRSMAAWVADLVGRMFDAYPESEDPLSEPAIVLVDEFDLHLHPRWQRESIGFLTSRFPAIQFIVTAHSPLVVQSAPDVNVAVLRHNGEHVVIENDPVSIRTWRVDQIMTSELFGLKTARSPDVQALLDERAALLRKPTLTASEKARARELEELTHSIPEAESPSELRSMKMLEELTERLRATLQDEEHSPPEIP